MKTLLLKISGEVLAGSQQAGFDKKELDRISQLVIKLLDKKIRLGLVVGAGNIVRGHSSSFIDRRTADQAGMLGTVVNALMLKGSIGAMSSYKPLVYSALPIEGIANRMSYNDIDQALNNQNPVIFSAGIAAPYFSTDIAAVLRALEIKADLLIKATKVDGLYSADPEKDPNAIFIPKISYEEAIERKLHVMDLSALSLAMENRLPIRICHLDEQSIVNVLDGKDTGTLVC